MSAYCRNTSDSPQKPDLALTTRFSRLLTQLGPSLLPNLAIEGYSKDTQAIKDRRKEPKVSAGKIQNMLEKWHRRIRATHKGHYKDAAILETRQRKLGIIVVILSTIVGSSIFASIATNPSTEVKLITGSLSVLVVVLATLQTYLNYPAKVITHILAATQLSSIKKKIEEQLSAGADEQELKAFISEVRREWDTITAGAPLMSEACLSG